MQGRHCRWEKQRKSDRELDCCGKRRQVVLTILIAEPVLCPHTSGAIGSMNGVDEAITAA